MDSWNWNTSINPSISSKRCLLDWSQTQTHSRYGAARPPAPACMPDPLGIRTSICVTPDTTRSTSSQLSDMVDYDEKVCLHLLQPKTKFALLIGYMRAVSNTELIRLIDQTGRFLQPARSFSPASHAASSPSPRGCQLFPFFPPLCPVRPFLRLRSPRPSASASPLLLLSFGRPAIFIPSLKLESLPQEGNFLASGRAVLIQLDIRLRQLSLCRSEEDGKFRCLEKSN